MQTPVLFSKVFSSILVDSNFFDPKVFPLKSKTSTSAKIEQNKSNKIVFFGTFFQNSQLNLHPQKASNILLAPGSSSFVRKT